MTKSDWLTIAAMTISGITTLSQPFVFKIVNRGKKQPMTSPEEKKLANLEQRSNLLERFIKPNWYIWWQLSIGLANGWVLVLELNRTTPVTRASVLIISGAVAGIALVLALISVQFISRLTYQHTDLIIKFSNINNILTDAVSGLTNHAKDTQARLDALENRPLEVEKPTGLLNIIRRLLGD